MLSIAATAAYASAQNAFMSTGGCCPTNCPTVQAQTCCMACPVSCSDQPSKMKTPTCSSSTCDKSVFSWTAPSSCSPITQQEMSCSGSDGKQNLLPTIFGTLSSWTIDSTHFMRAPFNLKQG